MHIHRKGNDGKIVEHKAIRDDVTFMMQLGVVGPTSEYDKLFQAWKGFTQSQIPQVQVSKQSTDDEAGIRSLYFQMIDGWNQGDGDSFASPFAEDGDLVGFDGTHLKGRQQIASFHQQLLDTYVKGSRLVGKIRNVRFLTPDVAIMHVVGGTIMKGQSSHHRGDQTVHTRFRPNSRNDDNGTGALRQDARALSKSGQSRVGTLEFGARSQTVI